MLRIADNSRLTLSEEELHHLPNLQQLADIELDVNKMNSDFLVFSNRKENFSDERILSIENNELRTNNIMGFIGVNNTDLTIHSRFSKDREDYFFHYMLQKVFTINLYDLSHSTDKENVLDFLIYIFPFFLNKALRQGLYKEYVRKDYNNSNVNRTINIAHHVRQNIPFSGRIAYSTREHSFDNNITQLVRHTIEYINQKKSSQIILNSSTETRTNVAEITQATPTYSKQQKQSVIDRNLKPFVHPYFMEYSDLQKVCLQILKYEGLKYGESKDKVYGLLFDGAWLWEEYLDTVLSECDFKHPRNDLGKGGIYLFEKPRSYKRYPDFWKEDFIIDAKYKKLDDKRVDRNDMNQIISYMYVTKAKISSFMFPTKGTEILKRSVGKLNGYGGQVMLFGLPIPIENDSFESFKNEMIDNEEELKRTIKEIEYTQLSVV